MTLKELLTQHPEYEDLDVAVYSIDGNHHYLGASCSAYTHEEMKDVDGGDCIPSGKTILIFDPY